MALTPLQTDLALTTRAGTAIPSGVAQAISSGAQASGADFGYLLAQAGVESSFRPELEAKTSSATGLFQFIEQTWLGMVHRHGEEHGLAAEQATITKGSNGRFSVDDPAMRQHILDLRRDPELSARMAGEFAAENSARLEQALGRQPDQTELYLAHFLGGGGAVKFLTAHAKNPDQSGAALMPAAARTNPNIFNDPATGQPRSLDAIHKEFARRLDLHSAEDISPIRFAEAPTDTPRHKGADLAMLTEGLTPGPRPAAPPPLPGSIARLSPLTSWLLAEVQSDMARL